MCSPRNTPKLLLDLFLLFRCLGQFFFDVFLFLLEFLDFGLFLFAF